MKTTTEQIHKELDLIQDIIKRMASNSFKVKTWMIAIIGFVITISENVIFIDISKSINESASLFVSLFLVLVVLIFWYLDAFFLRVERKYRKLYQWVVQNRRQTDEYLYDMNTLKRKVNNKDYDISKGLLKIWGVMVSKTLLPFYFLPLVFSLGILLYHILICLSN